MVCKEEVVSWFKESVSYKRLDLMCTLLNMCLPFELRFLGTCLEELGKRDYTELRDSETRANSHTDVLDAQCVSDKHTRRKLALYLALLHSANHGCSNVLYKTLANFDFAEIQALLGNSGSLAEEDNPLDELLLLYMMALNHPAFTYEQKSVFGSILMKLQDEETKISYPQKPALVCMKAAGMPVSRPMLHMHPSRSHSLVWQPIYMPCTASPDASSGAVGQHYAAPLKPILLPTAGLSNAGDSSKNMPPQEMHYFQVFPPHAPGHQPSGSVLFCSLPPPHGMAQAMGGPNTSGAEYPCHQTTFLMPSMGAADPCHSSSMAPPSVNNSLPSSAPNPEYSSPYQSHCGSPCGSPEASRSGSPNWCSSSGQPATGGATYKGGSSGPPRNGSSSSSSSCSGGSTGGGGGYRSSRSSHSRNKQMHNGQMPLEESASQHSAEQMRLPNADEQLRGMLANMTMANGRGGVEPRQRVREDKRPWANPAAPANQNSGSASSQSESPSPPRSPPQDETWEQCKDEAIKWDKVPMGVPPHAHLPPARGGQPPPRSALGPTVLRNPQQDMKHGRRPLHNMAAMPYTLYAAAGPTQGMQPLRASTGAIFQASPSYIGGTALFPTSMMPPPTSGPASFPPFTPNGITSPPPEMMYAVPPSSQTSPPPFPVQQQQFAPSKQQQTSSPPPPFLSYAPSYPPPPLSTNAKLTCYNCGGSNHCGTDCHEPSIEEVMRRGQYHLDYAKGIGEASLPSQQQQVAGGNGSSGSNSGVPPATEK